ncbi:MAG: (Fe-S)-binding protein [Thermoplasmata archaeon]|nr:(Fe-S)-binding protein [Thermoplasmata archaeon]
MEAKNLKKFEQEMNTCIRCAYCSEECPVIVQKGWDTDGARGKVALSYGLLSGDLEPTQSIADKLFQCTLCRNCESKCPSGVEVCDIITSARADLVEKGYASDIHNTVIKNIKETGNIYGDTEVMAPLQEGEVPLFVGCQYLSRPNKTKKYIKILEKLGINVKVGREICCGFPMEVLGFKDDLEKHKGQFKVLFPHKEAITLCPTCTVFLRVGHDVDAKHILQIILDKLPEANLDMKVTFHDPCDFSRGLKIIDEPRQILEKLGVEVVEMKNNKGNSSCCGGGGGLLMSDSKLSDDIALARIRQAIDTGADTVITTCPTCETVLKKAATQIKELEGKDIVVRNIEDIIWKGLK